MAIIYLNISYILLISCAQVVRNGENDETSIKPLRDICRYVSVFTRLENITDARYVINRGYDMPGFTAMGGFKVRF